MFQGGALPSASHFTVYINVSAGRYDTPLRYVMTGTALHQSLHKLVVFTRSEFVYQALYQEHWLDSHSSGWVQHKHKQAPRWPKIVKTRAPHALPVREDI